MSNIISVKARAVAGTEAFGFASTGTKQVAFTVEALEGDKKGQNFPWYGFFSEKAGKRTFEQLEVAGWKSDDDGWRAFAEGKLPGLGSTEFMLQLEEEQEVDEQGQPAGTYWRATFLNRFGVAMKAQMDQSQQRAFAAEMKAMFGGGGPIPSAPRQRGAAPAGQPSTVQQRGNGAPAQRQAAPQQRSAPQAQQNGGPVQNADGSWPDEAEPGASDEPDF